MYKLDGKAFRERLARYLEGFSADIVTNWRKERFAAWELVTHYRQRGTFEDRLGEWNSLGLNLSQGRFAKNEVTLLLSMLAFNLLEILKMEKKEDSRASKLPMNNPG